MTPKEILEQAASETLRDPETDGDVKLELLPGMSQDEIAVLERQLPGPMPDEVRELLRFTRGFSLGVGAIEQVELDMGPFEVLQAKPGLAGSWCIAHDGTGNFWFVDIERNSGAWGSVFYACHDPPVFALQAKDLATFFEEVLNQGRGEGKSAITDVYDEGVMRIWKQEPYALEASDARVQADEVLRGFAAAVGETYRLVDLRSKQVGAGISWGKAGPEAKVQRLDHQLVFAVEASKRKGSWLGRLFGR